MTTTFTAFHQHERCEGPGLVLRRRRRGILNALAGLKGLSVAARLRVLVPRQGRRWRPVAGLYSHLGRHDEALELLHRSVQVSGRAPAFLGYLGREQTSAGRAAEARETLAEIDKRAASEYVSPLFPAMVHSALGEMDRAFELLEEAVRTGNGWIACPRMRMFDGFRKDPRFVEHLRRIGQPDVPALDQRGHAGEMSPAQ